MEHPVDFSFPSSALADTAFETLKRLHKEAFEAVSNQRVDMID